MARAILTIDPFDRPQVGRDHIATARAHGWGQVIPSL